MNRGERGRLKYVNIVLGSDLLLIVGNVKKLG